MPDMKEMLGVREVLQSLEDALIDNGMGRDHRPHRAWPVYLDFG